MYLLGYDISSSSVKASLVDVQSGKCAATAFYPKTEASIISHKPGGGGGGGSGTGTGGGNGNTNGQSNDYAALTIGDKTLKLWYGIDVAYQLKAPFQATLSNMQNTISQFVDILSKLLNLDNFDTKIEAYVGPSGGFADGESGNTIPTFVKINGHFYRYSKVVMNLNVKGKDYGFLEEFFHALQFLYTERTEQAMKGDIEFEAKAFMGKMIDLYFQNDTSNYLTSNYDYFKTISDYVDNRTEVMRDSALNAFFHLGYENSPMKYEGADLSTYLGSILTTYHLYF